jgi:hypothetical protein
MAHELDGKNSGVETKRLAQRVSRVKRVHRPVLGQSAKHHHKDTKVHEGKLGAKMARPRTAKTPGNASARRCGFCH